MTYYIIYIVLHLNLLFLIVNARLSNVQERHSKISGMNNITFSEFSFIASDDK